METNFANPSFWTYFIGSYAYYLPFVLTMVWAPLALFGLSKQKDMTTIKQVVWSLLILVVPVVGPALYLLLVDKEYDKKFKQIAVGGGLGVFLLVWILSLISHI
ncbi:MAG: phospholipase [Leptospira bouyouniensis]|uniref:Phospholipase n=1 Tax=Leptospira bouyouniensis TaxID=2484911 RepID=A0A7I0HWK5_9LEPT|nr:phospholipase [Leptospira bouyouniensis]TGK52943.1 phospholipase [Leptospira bouyouniensis]TGL08422.1 phospholipase [Leptospira bouyouniensis]TGM87159.1 phospholipase [Leptospira bouyouniensis]